jgi:hypothetical protein
MAKKDNTIYYVAGLAVLGGGYYAYKKGFFNKLMGKGAPMPTGALTSGTSTTSDEAILNKAQANVVQTARESNPLTNPNSYQSKIAYIQERIFTTPDGIVGADTNRKFDEIYGFDNKGGFSPLNIDYYVARVKANNTKAQISAINAKIASAATLSNRTISSFKAAWDAGYRSWALTIPYTASEFLSDKASNGLKPTGRKLLFNNGDLMLKGMVFNYKPTNAVWGGSTISLSFDGGKTFYSFLPANLVLNK